MVGRGVERVMGARRKKLLAGWHVGRADVGNGDKLRKGCCCVDTGWHLDVVPSSNH